MNETTSEIIESVKDRASIPDGDPVLTSAKLLKWLDDETLSILVPTLIERREGHLIKPYDYDLEVGVDRYRIPERAYGEKLTTVQVVEASEKVRTLTPSSKDEINNHKPATGTPQQFYLEGSEVVVFPVPANSGETLRLNHYRRPNALVVTEDAGFVSEVTSSTIVLVDASMFDDTQAFDYDVVRGKQPHDWLTIDASATLVGNTLTFSDFDPVAAGVVRGDYVALAQKTCVPNLPRDLIPILCQLGAIRFLETQGDLDLLEAAIRRFSSMVDSAGAMLGNRVDQALIKVANTLSRSVRNRFPVGD